MSYKPPPGSALLTLSQFPNANAGLSVGPHRGPISRLPRMNRDHEIQDALRGPPLAWHSCAVSVEEWLRYHSMFKREELSSFFQRNRNRQFQRLTTSGTMSHVCYDQSGRTPLMPRMGAPVGPPLESLSKRRKPSTSPAPIPPSPPAPPHNATIDSDSRSDADHTQSTRISTSFHRARAPHIYLFILSVVDRGGGLCFAPS